jgi:hypothetical protein
MFEAACGVRLQACRVESRLDMSGRRHDCRRGTPGGARYDVSMGLPPTNNSERASVVFSSCLPVFQQSVDIHPCTGSEKRERTNEPKTKTPVRDPYANRRSIPIYFN